MAVPKFFEFFRPTLEALYNAEEMKTKDMTKALAEKMCLSEEDMAQMLSSGRQATYQNRIHWSLQYLKNAGLVERISHGTYRITANGKTAYESGEIIDLEYLNRFDSFRQFHTPGGSNTHEAVPPTPEATPKELIENAYRTIHDELAKTLLRSIMDSPWEFFEKLVVDLLLAMGYGYDSKNAGRVTRRTGDGGIDGIISEDKLGFNQVYVQAKRWNEGRSVGGPDVHAFIGSLVSHGATKGLFITTSHFTEAAKQAAANAHGVKLILVDGAELTKLMIDNGVGVSTQCTYTVKEIDNDYFEE